MSEEFTPQKAHEWLGLLTAMLAESHASILILLNTLEPIIRRDCPQDSWVIDQARNGLTRQQARFMAEFGDMIGGRNPENN